MKMTWFEIFLMVYHFIVNTLRGIYKPQPDTRYKLKLEGDFIVNSFGDKLSSVLLNSDFFLEVEVDDTKLKFPTFSKNSNVIAICGLPLVSLGETKINVIDNISDEIVCSFNYKNGEFINYVEISKKCNIFVFSW